MQEEFDANPSVPHIVVSIMKKDRIVGLKAADAGSATEYPFVDMIGQGTAVHLSGKIAAGDRVKCINGVHMIGKSKAFLHGLVKEVPLGKQIRFHIVKGFKGSEYVASSTGGLRVASVRRSNPLLSLGPMEPEPAGGLDAMAEEEEEEEAPAEEAEEAPRAGDGRSNRRGSVYGGFGGGAEDEPPAPRGFKGRKASVYGGFGGGAADTEESSAPTPRGFRRKASVYGGFGGEAETPAADEDEFDGFDGFS